MPKRPARPKSDTSRRVLRTGFQAITVQVLIQLWNAFAANDVTTDQAAILTIVGTPLLSFVQNWLETHGAVPEMLKGKPDVEPTQPPPDDLTRRELNALATAHGHHQLEIDRIDVELQDIRKDLYSRPTEPEKPVFTGQIAPHPWPPGGLG